MKFVSFKNVKAIVMTKGELFGAPIHYLVTNDNKLYQIMASLKDCFDDCILKEGMFVNDTDVSILYLRQNGLPKLQGLTIYRRLKNNIDKKSVENFITENYARFKF